MTQSIFTVAETVNLDNQGLQSNTAKYVQVDNLTSSWMYLPDAIRFVPPLTWGAVFALIGNVQSARAQWRTPPGIIAPVPDSGTATVIFTDDTLTPSSGVSLLSPSQPIHLATFTTRAGGIVSPPPGTDSLLIALPPAIGSGAIQIVGQQTGTQYNGTVTATATGGMYAFPIDMGADLSYLVSYAGGASGTAWSVDASFVVSAVQIQGTNTPLAVNLQLINGTAPIAPAGFVPVSAVKMQGGGVALEAYSDSGAAPRGVYLLTQPRPTFDLLSTRVSLAVAGAVIIAAPGAGSSIVLRKMILSTSSAAAAGSVIGLGTTGAGVQLAEIDVPLGTATFPQPGVYEVDWGDYLVGDNLAVNIHGPVAFANVSIIITYAIVTTADWPAS